MGTYTFNLIDEPWIRCTDLNGQTVTIGFRETIARAHVLKRVDYPNPLATASVMRNLLALIHRVVNGPKNRREWENLYSAGRFTIEDFDSYFMKWRRNFDLFDEETPFRQHPKLAVIRDGVESPVLLTTLLHEYSTDSCKSVFNHLDEQEEIIVEPAEAAVILIKAQCYHFGGLNRKSSNLLGFQQSFPGAALLGGICVYLTGDSLFETLMYNLLEYSAEKPKEIPSTPDDAPSWERPLDVRTGTQVPKGYLDYLTANSRLIRFVPETVGGRTVVRKMHIAQGPLFSEVREPFFFRKKNAKEEYFYPRLDTDRALWRDSSALFAFSTEGKDDERPVPFRQYGAYREYGGRGTERAFLKCEAYGLAYNQANPYAWRSDSLTFPSELLSNEDLVSTLLKGLQIGERVGVVLSDSVKTFMKNRSEKDQSEQVSGKAAASGVLATFWAGLELPFRSFLANVNREESLRTWYKALTSTARRAHETGLSVFVGRSALGYKAWYESKAELERGLVMIFSKGTVKKPVQMEVE